VPDSSTISSSTSRTGARGSAAHSSPAIAWFTARGVRRVMLWSAQANADAQRLFRAVGFRPTMIEMTLDC
jgi:hypothetical protein